MLNIALYGGTFDPVHIGHVRTAIELQNFGFDRVLMIPNSVPPHKPQPKANFLLRVDMIELAISKLKNIEVSTIEYQLSEVNYTIDTVKYFRKKYGKENITLVIGLDAWLNFHQWYQPENILQHVNVLIVSRHDVECSIKKRDTKLIEWLAEREVKPPCEILTRKCGSITHVDFPLLTVSSSKIRHEIKCNNDVSFLTPDTVLKYIHRHHLYTE
jgi:nicotinate-nucleotide adenylyltransferase